MYIIHSTHKPEKNNHLQHSGRILLPVGYLKEAGYDLVSCDALHHSEENSRQLLVKYNGENYLESFKIDSILTTLCEACSYENLLTNKVCTMCYNVLPKRKTTYIDDDNDTLITEDTYDELVNVGKILLEIVEKYKNLKYIYALIRPPGHHASENHHSGFCIINNAYIVSRELVSKDERVLIFDWDLHHGDGTERLIVTNNDKNIVYVSVHYFSNDFFPKTGSGEYVSDNIFNFPINKYDFDKFTDFFDIIVKPVLSNLIDRCDVIVISNGLDAHKDDPINVLNLEDNDYVHMTKYFKSTNKNIIYLLEGGYNPDVIKNVSEKIIQTINNNNV